MEGDRRRIRPAERLTPALRYALARRKPELLALLALVREYVTLRLLERRFLKRKLEPA